MDIIKGSYYKQKDKNQNLIYQAIDSQPLPERYRDRENEERYKNDQPFLIVDLLEKDISKMFFGKTLNTKQINFIPATEEEIKLYQAAELIYCFQEMYML
ncbi:hypothetical protein [Enterococcus mundtii]|uniref:hypothetical protein n=1 Tax=Enterococcus mundtii TaxID=53346 RepID=UPI0032DF2E58